MKFRVVGEDANWRITWMVGEDANHGNNVVGGEANWPITWVVGEDANHGKWGRQPRQRGKLPQSPLSLDNIS
jgi:hypothetical protein